MNLPPDLTPYSYHPLAEGDFRLLRLNQGEVDAVLEAALEHERLDIFIPKAKQTQLEPPYYEALSYTWGEHIFNEYIVISGNKYLRVGENLVAALKRLRLPDCPRILWIDAICIDQSNVQERNQQVPLMRHIFGLAAKVQVYIGEIGSHSRSEDAMRAIADFDGELTEDQEDSVSELWTRPWFSRIWVVQEVALSRCAVVICGPQAVSWSCFSRWPLRVSSVTGKSLPGVLKYSPGFTPSNNYESFLQMLYNNRGAGATDPRDLIFGILGLLSSHDIRVDYSRRTEDIYTDVTFMIICASSSLRILSAAGITNSRSSDHLCGKFQVPSWVPNWTLRQQESSMALEELFVEAFDAGGRCKATTINTASTRLKVTGVRVDSIAQVYRRNRTAQTAADMLDILRDWKLNLSASDYDNDLKLLRTISASPSRTVRASETEASNDLARLVDIFGYYCARYEVVSQLISEAQANHYLLKRMFKLIRGRQLFTTKAGSLGLGPDIALEGDIIVVLLGGPVPYILRPFDGAGSAYQLVGECYIDGIMHGEALHHVRGEAEAMGCRLPPTSSGPCLSPLETIYIV